VPSGAAPAVTRCSGSACTQQAAVAGVDDAKQQAQAYLRQAQLEADAMLAHARDHVTAADDAYRQAHHAALTAGWSPAALPTWATARRRRSNETGTSPPTPTRPARPPRWCQPRPTRRGWPDRSLTALPAREDRPQAHGPLRARHPW